MIPADELARLRELAQKCSGRLEVAVPVAPQMLLRLLDALEQARCPYVVTSDEGTSHCRLAEQDARALEQVTLGAAAPSAPKEGT